jgi:hypothetical protein
MKRLIALMIVLAFVAVVPSAVFANGVVYKNASQWCTANDDLQLKNHGTCVSLVKACEEQGNTGPVCSCKEFLNADPTGFYVEYNNLDECIDHLRLGYIPD